MCIRDRLNIIGTVAVPEYSSIGAHNGSQGAEVIIQGYDGSSMLSVAGTVDKTLFLTRSHSILYNLFAVSYTHLDVYKRQAIGGGRGRGRRRSNRGEVQV